LKDVCTNILHYAIFQRAINLKNIHVLIFSSGTISANWLFASEDARNFICMRGWRTWICYIPHGGKSSRSKHDCDAEYARARVNMPNTFAIVKISFIYLARRRLLCWTINKILS